MSQSVPAPSTHLLANLFTVIVSPIVTQRVMPGNWHYWQGGHRITENRHDQPEPGGEATMVATGERLIQLDKGKRRHTA